VRPASNSTAPDTENRNIIEACSADKEDKFSCGLHLMLTLGKMPASHSAAPDTENRNVIEASSADKEDKSSCGLHLMLTTRKTWREASIKQRCSCYRK
jgi:hypothetical protein